MFFRFFSFFNCSSYFMCSTSFTWLTIVSRELSSTRQILLRGHQHQVQLCQWLHFCKRCAIVCNSIDGGRAAHWKKRWLMSQGVASDLNRNKATCVFLSYWKSKSWPQTYKFYKLWVIRIPVLETLCLWVWAFWGWLRRRVLSPLSVLPGQNFVLLFSFYETRSYRINVALIC